MRDLHKPIYYGNIIINTVIVIYYIEKNNVLLLSRIKYFFIN